jgi:hypothetical protein
MNNNNNDNNNNNNNNNANNQMTEQHMRDHEASCISANFLTLQAVKFAIDELTNKDLTWTQYTLQQAIVLPLGLMVDVENLLGINNIKQPSQSYTQKIKQSSIDQTIDDLCSSFEDLTSSLTDSQAHDSIQVFSNGSNESIFNIIEDYDAQSHHPNYHLYFDDDFEEMEL